VQARDTSRATALLDSGSRLSPPQAARVSGWLHSAGTLNPDRQVELLRARLASNQGHAQDAVAIIESVTRSEPLDVFAWVQLGFTAGAAHQLGVGQLAANHVAQLVAKLKKR
jgi:hypothetical protein